MATKSGHDYPQVAKRGLVTFVVAAGAAVTVEMGIEQYWAQTLQPLESRLKGIIFHSDFQRNCHSEEVRAQIYDILETFVGVAQGASERAIGPIFQYTSSVLNELPKLLTLYHNYQQIVQAILELFTECSKSMLSYLNRTESVRFYEICLTMIQAYASCNSNRVTTDSTAEEDAFQDILLLMQLLTNLLNKDFFNDYTETKDTQVTEINVFLYGLNIVMPLMTINLLKFPSLCLQ